MTKTKAIHATSKAKKLPESRRIVLAEAEEFGELGIGAIVFVQEVRAFIAEAAREYKAGEESYHDAASWEDLVKSFIQIGEWLTQQGLNNRRTNLLDLDVLTNMPWTKREAAKIREELEEVRKGQAAERAGLLRQSSYCES